MNKKLYSQITFLFILSTIFQAHALDSLEDRICANLKQGAFSRTGALQINPETCGKKDPKPAPGLNFDGKSDEAIRADLKKMGIQYLFQLNSSDIKETETPGKYRIPDFMKNAVAESRTDHFSAQRCLTQNGKRSETFARFDRFSESDSMGGYLLVNENDSTATNLTADDSFTVGTWVKLKSDYQGGTADGYFPILSKSALNTENPEGTFEWEFKLTSERAYININRKTHGQNNLNQKLPWWADRFGSCYQYGIHRECWHFIAMSVNPKNHQYSVMMLRRFNDELPGNVTESFENYETSVSENKMPIPASAKTALRLGGSNTNSMDGILKGTFFAKKALSRDELRALAKLTTPSKELTFQCAPAR